MQGSSGGLTSVTIQFRPYGVKLDFTPTVNPDGTIQLRVAPEVSALDYTNAVTISGYTIPALSTRRAETQVVLRSGQSFAISGLLDKRTTDQLSKTPGVGQHPDPRPACSSQQRRQPVHHRADRDRHARDRRPFDNRPKGTRRPRNQLPARPFLQDQLVRQQAAALNPEAISPSSYQGSQDAMTPHRTMNITILTVCVDPLLTERVLSLIDQCDWAVTHAAFDTYMSDKRRPHFGENLRGGDGCLVILDFAQRPAAGR